MRTISDLDCVTLNLAAVEGDDLAFDAIVDSITEDIGEHGYKVALMLNSVLLQIRQSPERDGWCRAVRQNLRENYGCQC